MRHCVSAAIRASQQKPRRINMTIARVKFAPLLVAAIFALAAAATIAAWSQGSPAATAAQSEARPSASQPVHPAIYFSKQEVEANFVHPTRVDGALYVSDYGTRSFEVKTSTREKPLAAEIHWTYTDIIYVVKGSATLVTGGKMVGDATPRTYPDGRPFGKETTMGRSIVGGQSRHISVGDVVIIPNGLPHWFTDIEAPFWFYNVKSH
jgi:glc operon protein GlcG